MIFIQYNSKINSLDNYYYMTSDFSTNSEYEENFEDFYNLSHMSNTSMLELDTFSFLEAKRLRKEKQLYDYAPNDKEYSFDDINKLLSNDNKSESKKESTYIKAVDSIKKKFKVIKLEKPGRKRKNENNKQFTNKKTHGKYSFDNVITKIQAHYINFIINLANDIIKSVSDGKKDNKRLCFKNIEYKAKIYYNYNKFQELKTKCIKDILIKPASKKNNLNNDNYNEEIFNDLIDSPDILDEYFNMNYLSLFDFYYNDGQKLNSIIINNKEIKLSNKTMSLWGLLNKNQNNNCKMRNLIFECINMVFLRKKELNIKDNETKTNVFNIIK